MSHFLINPAGNIPYTNTITPVNHAYSYYADQAVSAQQRPSTGQEALPVPSHHTSLVPGQQLQAPPYQPNTSSWNQYQPVPYGQSWVPGPLISSVSVSSPAKTDPAPSSILEQSSQKIQSLESELQSVRSQLEQQQTEGRNLQGQVDALKAELATEKQRSDELSRQLQVASASHHALLVDHERLIGQHAAVVREHEHMTSCQAATMRELEARHGDVTRLQRQLEEAQAAAVAAAKAEAAATAAAAAVGGKGTGNNGSQQPGGPADHNSMVSPRAHGGAGGPSLMFVAAEEERWALRLHKAERALEEERRVSEDLRQQLAVAEAEGRDAVRRAKQLESHFAAAAAARTGDATSPSAAIASASSAPLPLSPRPPPSFFPTSGPASMPAGSTAGSGASLSGMASAPPGIGAGGSAGVRSSFGSFPGGSFSPPIPSPGNAPGWPVGGRGGGGGGPGTGAEAGFNGPTAGDPDLVARLKREVDSLRSDLARMAAAEEAQRVTVRAAEDRARAAELVSLDVRRQCDQAARTIGRLIEENNEMVAKINTQANALADYKTAIAAKESELRTLQGRIAQAEAHIATQAQALSQVPTGPGASGPANGPTFSQPPPHGDNPHLPHPSNASPARPGAPVAGLGSPPGHAQTRAPPPSPLHPGAAPPLPQRGSAGGALTEADWKLLMLSEEVRRLVEEVSLARTACAALEVRAQCEQRRTREGSTAAEGSSANGARGTVDGPSSSAADAALDLPRILSRLESLAGRRLGAGETAAYIIELAGHMEALERVLQEQQQRMDVLRGDGEAAPSVRQPGAQAPEGAAAGAPANGALAASVGQQQQQQAQQGQPARAAQGPGEPQQQQPSSEHRTQPQPTSADVHMQRGSGQGRRSEDRKGPGGPQQQHHQAGPPVWGTHPQQQRDSKLDAAAPAPASSTSAAAADHAEVAPGRGPHPGLSSDQVAFGSFMVRDSGSLPHEVIASSSATAAPAGAPHLHGGTVLPAPPPASTGASAPALAFAPAAYSIQHVVSPFLQLSHGNPADGPQQPAGAATGAQGWVASVEALASQDLHLHPQRQDFAAAAAAAIAAADAAAVAGAAADGGQGGQQPELLLAAGLVAPALASVFQAPPLPRAAPAPATVPAIPAGALVVTPVGSGTALATEELGDDELLDEMAAGRSKSRGRGRVGLWGWISGETTR